MAAHAVPTDSDTLVVSRNLETVRLCVEQEADQLSEERMSIKSTVMSQVQQIAAEDEKTLPPLADDLVLLDSGLDSLAIAILVARLEETLGLDPFTESDEVSYPVTLGDFITFYERAAKSREGDSRHAR
jgi:acyl carrier protein